MRYRDAAPGVRRWLWLLLPLLSALVVLGGWLRLARAGTATVTGTVLGADGPVANARVRVRATENLTFTDGDGHFVLTNLAPGQPIQVTAWYTGYYIAGTHVTPTIAGVVLSLRPFHQEDHPEYEWTPPTNEDPALVCGDCHPMILDQWLPNAHGQAVHNDRFFSLYAGTDLSGATVVTPGYLTDFPGTNGNCANCHAPAWAADGYLTTPMLNARGVVTAGIHCDFCHKVGGVYLNPATGSVYGNAPGVQSLRLLRPPPGDDVFFGPFDDVPDPDTYLALQDESQFCAPCHQFSFWGTPIYESYEEWLNSSYAAAGVTCQDCHMVPNGDAYFALPEFGGLPHPPAQIPSHAQPGAAAADLLGATVSMTVTAQQVGGGLHVTVTITNTGAGHHVPTDHPGRNLVLLVSAEAETGGPLALRSGPVVPEWAGAAAGQPGQGFAKVLQEVATGRFPVVNYWVPTLVRSDNRIPALAADVSHFVFELPAAETDVVISADLHFHRLFEPLAIARGWPLTDVVMAAETMALSARHYQHYLPVVPR